MTTDLTVNEHSPITLNVENNGGTDFSHSEEYILAVSPSASVTQTETGAVITVKDKFGTTSAVLLNGQDGKDGADGKAGNPGAQGPKGDTGPRGERGERGPKGDTGATGSQGPKGDKGDTGATGPQGPKGDTGERGPQGPKGETGAEGPKGDNGADGKDGQNGQDGEKGETGQRGTGLLKITTAPSAYTTKVEDFSPKYRIALATVIPQAHVDEVLVGDTIECGYYHYGIGYVDETYAYTVARTSIRGATGAKGATGDPGSDATVTAENIAAALGYTPVSGDVMNVTIDESFAVPSFFACDAYTKAVLDQITGGNASIALPSDFSSLQNLLYALEPRKWFAWLNGAELEFARLGVSINVSTQAATLYLKGRISTATGIMGVDSAWTVTPN